MWFLVRAVLLLSLSWIATGFVVVPLHHTIPTKSSTFRHHDKRYSVQRIFVVRVTKESSSTFEIIKEASVIDPSTGSRCTALDGAIKNGPLDTLFGNKDNKLLVVVMPQLGDFDSGEYAEHLMAILDDLKQAGIALRLIGIGDEGSAKRFAQFNRVPLNLLRVDPEGSLHRTLKLHGGPGWDIPDFVPDFILNWFAVYVGASDAEDKRAVARAWLNYMAMCAGIAAPDTLPEILRGYIGDKSAPERIRPDDVVTVGDNLIVVKGVSDVKLGPIEYQSLWKNETGYQRPAELATVRLRVMVEVLTHFSEYVSDQRHLHLRGATFLFDGNGKLLYEHRDTGVLAYSETMSRPLTFLRPYIGDKALNALQLGDQSFETQSELVEVK